MRLKLLAISDTHLGEETSLLSFPRGRQHLWDALRKAFSDNYEEKFVVEELILLGDITDRTLSSTSQIVTHTNAFTRMLGSAADIKKGVFLPGNHEHTLWTDYHQRRAGKKNHFSVTTKPDGELILKKGKRNDKNNSADELLEIFFGYPFGSSWRRILKGKEKLDFAVANPVYVKHINGTTYVFTHGTHFRRDVSAPKTILRIADYMQLDRLLGDIEIDSNCDVSKAKSLRGLEKTVSRFVDSLWPSSRNNPTSQSDQLWYLLTTLGGKLKKEKDRRSSPADTLLLKWPGLKKKAYNDRIKRLTAANGKAKDKSIERWQKYFRSHMFKYLKIKNIPKDNIVFVYGDTHDGGWGEQQLKTGEKIRIFNTGGWVVHNSKDHPACHLFAVDEDGQEHILDVSFKNIKVSNEKLLDLAARDNENHHRNSSRILRFFTKCLWWD